MGLVNPLCLGQALELHEVLNLPVGQIHSVVDVFNFDVLSIVVVVVVVVFVTADGFVVGVFVGTVAGRIKTLWLNLLDSTG